MNLENGPLTTYSLGFVKSDKFNVDLKCSLCALSWQYTGCPRKKFTMTLGTIIFT